MLAARALVWLPGPIVFFAQFSRVRALPAASGWAHVSPSLHWACAALSALLAIAMLVVGVGLIARRGWLQERAPAVLWAMLLTRVLVIFALVIPDLIFLPRLGGHWLPTLASLGLTAREALADIGWAAVLIVFLRRRAAHPDEPALLHPLRGTALPSMIAVAALLVVFREAMGIVTAPFSLNSLIASIMAGSPPSWVSLAAAASVAAPLLALVCGISLALAPRLARPTAAAVLAFAAIRQVTQLVLAAPAAYMGTLTVASLYYVPVATLLEYAVMAVALVWAPAALRSREASDAEDEA